MPGYGATTQPCGCPSAHPDFVSCMDWRRTIHRVRLSDRGRTRQGRPIAHPEEPRYIAPDLVERIPKRYVPLASLRD